MDTLHLGKHIHSKSICEEEELGEIQKTDVGNPYFLNLRVL